MWDIEENDFGTVAYSPNSPWASIILLCQFSLLLLLDAKSLLLNSIEQSIMHYGRQLTHLAAWAWASPCIPSLHIACQSWARRSLPIMVKVHCTDRHSPEKLPHRGEVKKNCRISCIHGLTIKEVEVEVLGACITQYKYENWVPDISIVPFQSHLFFTWGYLWCHQKKGMSQKNDSTSHNYKRWSFVWPVVSWLI